MLDFDAFAAVARVPPASIGADRAEAALAAHGFHPAAALALIAAGRLAAAERACDAAIAGAEPHEGGGAAAGAGGEPRRDAVPASGDGALGLRALARVRRGAFAAAEADARRLVAAGDPFAIAALADALLGRGATADAERWLALAGPPERFAEDVGANFLLDALARLRLAQGRAPAALMLAREGARRLRALRIRNPGVVAWGSTLALAAAATGRTGEALDAADEQLHFARAFGVAREQELALHALAAIEGARVLTAVRTDPEAAA